MTEHKLNNIIRIIYMLSKDIPPELSSCGRYSGILKHYIDPDELNDVIVGTTYRSLVGFGERSFSDLLHYIAPKYQVLVTDIHNEMLMATL
jgi:hypothetical protein